MKETGESILSGIILVLILLAISNAYFVILDFFA